MPTGGKQRSLSSGDIVYVDGIPWGCRVVGWARLTPGEVASYLALPARDRLRAYRGWPQGETFEPLTPKAPLGAGHS